ncbi:MAG: HAD family phosphatase [Lachnospiraceae bacterium]|nr:HAD family phosphatase [Lachnospiraceae bacterium]
MIRIAWKGRPALLEAVVFDMDGLMFDSERVVMYSWDVAGKQLGYGPLGRNIYHTLGMGAKSRERYFRKTYGEEFPYEAFQKCYREAFYAYADTKGIPVKPGLRELLDFLKEQGIPAAMATSTGGQDVRKRLGREGLESYFQVIITGDMVKETKPSPEIYEKACRALQIEAAHAIALEDACNGIRSAYDAGMLPILVPDLQTDFSQVEELLYGKMASLLEVRKWLAQCCGKEYFA